MSKIDSKRLFAAISFSLVFSILMSLACFDASCEQVRENVLRLHIIANSDSDDDQKVKIAVRDALLCEFSNLFDGAVSLDEAETLAKKNALKLQQIAKSTLEQKGFDYSVKVEVAPSDFSTRVYSDNLTLPAGKYMAVRVLLGDAKGQNWWCVCFPNVCMGSAAKEVDTVLDSNGQRVVKNGQRFKVKFKIVEIYEQIKAKFR